ncbi:large ribosomal subunit protein uL23m [Dermacentor andersoni]|uniref:large ribosomal subunit protein uL23m n=1 Tax=Dermacentor andersoni TaxID=34620 RepID=UPI0024176BF2|nr:39S ribosomal protein L23, mitochondrial-like [Dermacentor andersoni]
MSTRVYPLYVKGNPQLRIFLPNFWMKLVKHEKPLPPNEVKFIIPVQMTKYDVKNYLEKIYKVPVADVRTAIMQGKIRKAEGKSYLVKEDDFRVAFVTLPQGETFTYPDLFSKVASVEKEKALKKQAEEAEKMQKVYIRKDPHREGLPNWFGL